MTLVRATCNRSLRISDRGGAATPEHPNGIDKSSSLATVAMLRSHMLVPLPAMIPVPNHGSN
jgi:hypothetical protein